MFTQCPDCGTAFRVTADVLKQAAGKVRCGGCGHAFNALMYLSETRPESKPKDDVDEALPELIPEPPAGDEPEPPRKISAAQSAALLKTLDQLAGEDIQLEDTGVEWRLMSADDEEADNDSPDDDTEDDELLSAGGYEVEESESVDNDVLNMEVDEDVGDAFTDTSVNDPSVNEVFAGSETPVDSALFEDAGAAHIDEVLNDAPTPVDQFLTQTPNHVEAEEVFADAVEKPDLDEEEVFAGNAGAADLEASEIFATPEPVRADELRFDDNTGLPDNFDFDNITAADAPADAVENEQAFTEDAVADDDLSAQADAELERFEASFETGDEDEWGELLEEVLPEVALASDAPVSDDAADDLNATGAAEWLADDTPAAPDGEAGEALAQDAVAEEATDDGGLDDDAHEGEEIPEPVAAIADAIPDERPMTLAEELAALPDDYDDADDEPDAIDAGAAAAPAEPAAAEDVPGIDLSGIYALTPDTPLELAVEAEPAAGEAPGEPEEAAPNEAEGAAVAADETANHDPEDAEPELALDNTDEPSIVLDKSLDGIPGSTSELEFELVKAQQMAESDAEPGIEHVVPPPTEEEQTVNMLIDEDLMRLAIPDDDGMASTIVFEGKSARRKVEDSGEHPAPETEDEPEEPSVEPAADTTGFESIIMEGDYVHTKLEQERLAAEAEARGDNAEDLSAMIAANAAAAQENSGGRSRRRHYGIVAGIVVLVLLLAGQFVHQSRASLATIPAVGNTIGPLYRAVGAPISPEWDVKGWRFDKSSASTNPNGLAAKLAGTPEPASDTGAAADVATGGSVLTIYSLLSNKSDTALPYPLISVSLLDRFEEPVGSKVYGPNEYLKGNVDASRLIAAGENFEAVIAIASPSANLDNFKLNACYRQSNGQLRCAFEDFK